MRKMIINKKAMPAGRQGFSLLELMIAIAIAGIMTAVMLVSMNSQREKKAVELAAREVATVVRETQTYALTGKGLKDHPICSFTFNWVAGSSYSISDCRTQAYTLKNEVNFTNAGSIFFSVPVANITPAGLITITLNKGGASGSNYYVCVRESGIVEESLTPCS